MLLKIKYMRKIFFQVFFLSMILSSCCQNTDTSKIKIKPLHPYSASPYYHKQNETKDKNFILKYFFIEGACKATDKLSNQVDSFITKYVQSDTDFVEFGAYYLYFYKRTKAINENFREVTDGMISHNLLDEYDNDLLFEYTFGHKYFRECNYYKGGKIVKTVYDKESGVLKRNPTLPLPGTGEIIIKDLGNVPK
jgi:hypothetical protein